MLDSYLILAAPFLESLQSDLSAGMKLHSHNLKQALAYMKIGAQHYGALAL